MRPMKLLALCSVLVCGFGSVAMAQAPDAQALYAAMLMGFPQETVQAGQGSAVQGTFFAFDPSPGNGFSVVRSGENPQGDNEVVVGSRNGGRILQGEQSPGPLQTFFAFDPTVRSGGN